MNLLTEAVRFRQSEDEKAPNDAADEHEFISQWVEIELDDIEFHELCGRGTFGSVYRATWKSKNKEVAIKRVLALDKEVEVFSILSHRNIIQFYGAINQPPNFYLVNEYAPHGSLYAILANPKNQVNYTQLLQWAKDIALGLNYLHNEAPRKVIHRDLKSRNVVISGDYVCKLCDFGASRFYYNTTRMSMAGTFPWMAPEVIQSQPTSESCDIWSYGVVLWELLTHEVPFKGIEGFQVAWLVVERNERLTIPKSCPKEFADVMNACWHSTPDERPTSRDILNQLEDMLTNENLSVATNSFLQQKQEWKAEIDDKLQQMKDMEIELREKEKQLLEREQKLKRREEYYSRSFHVPDIERHDVNNWNESEVFDWVMQIDENQVSCDLWQYADLFRSNHINGRRLLLLTQADLQSMGIASVGHRIHLETEIQLLKMNNYRLRHFPPLLATVASRSDSIETVSVDAEFLFGVHFRRADQAKDTKWKMYIEIDANDEQEVVIPSWIREIQLQKYTEGREQSEEKWRLAQHPYVMDRWLLGVKPNMAIEFVITFKEPVLRPRVLRHRYRVDVDNLSRVDTVAASLVVTAPRSASSSVGLSGNFRQSRSSMSSMVSPEGLRGAWRTRVLENAVHLPSGSSTVKNVQWANVVRSRAGSTIVARPSFNVGESSASSNSRGSNPPPAPRQLQHSCSDPNPNRRGSGSRTTPRQFSHGATQSAYSRNSYAKRQDQHAQSERTTTTRSTKAGKKARAHTDSAGNSRPDNDGWTTVIRKGRPT